jgi:hypothetical protein
MALDPSMGNRSPTGRLNYQGIIKNSELQINKKRPVTGRIGRVKNSGMG